MHERRLTRQIHVGDVPVGGGAPVSVQSMTTTKTADVDGTLSQVYALAAAGADIVRCTCNEEVAAEGLAQIVPRSPVPLVADIHFQYKLALAAMEAGVQALRLNPGNIRKPEPRTAACRSASASTPAASTPTSRSSTVVRRPRRWSHRRNASSRISPTSASRTSRSR
jgi:(E)-4-hydroxy-3-methylbut-2-enyl-diphosphate synthase